MTNQRRQLAIRGLIFAVVVVLLFFFSRYIPRPFIAFAPGAEDFDDFEGIYSSRDQATEAVAALPEKYRASFQPEIYVLNEIH